MTKPDTYARTHQIGEHFVFPDPPERDAAHAAAVCNALYKQDISRELLPLLGNADTTLITAGRYVIPHAGADTSRIPYPHMMVAHNVDVTLFEASKAYSAPRNAA